MKFKCFLQKNKYWLYILYVPLYLGLFFLVEKLVDGTSPYWISYLPIDRKIPFIDWFVIFYYLWYPLLVGVGLWLFIKDKKSYERFMKMIMYGFTFSLIFFLIVPNGQNLRPTEFENETIFTRLIGTLYKVDTNTNVFPSIHVYGSLICIFAILDTDTIKSILFKSLIMVIVIFICASTIFIKQHSFLDLIGGVAMFVPLYFAVYRERIFMPAVNVSENIYVNVVEENGCYYEQIEKKLER